MRTLLHAEQTQRRATIIVGIVLSVLLHALGFWFLLYSPLSVIKPPPASSQERIIVSLMPAPSSMPSKPAIPPPAPPPAPPVNEVAPRQVVPQPPAKEAIKKPSPPKKPVRKPDPARNPAPADTASRNSPAPTPPPDLPRREMSVPDDMFSQVEAARRRRAQTLAAEHPAPADSAAPNDNASRRDNSIAMANIAESLNRAKGTSRERDGGVFQIRRLGVHDAEFMFYGWSPNQRREASRLVTVDQGAEIDIQTAVVKKMIEIIREQRHEDFIWISDRLGREVTLSARLQDSAELQRFLLRDFFPDYVRLGQR